MKFCCVTPSFNSEKYIEETIRSVLNQTALKNLNNHLHYIIADGKSTDKTPEIVNKLISEYEKMPNIDITFHSEPDEGMYDGLCKAFKKKKSEADIYSYINCGDYYSPQAFEIVKDVKDNNKDVHFLTGINVWYNENSHIIRFNYPYKYLRRFIRKGVYGRQLPYIQQESTFWDLTLHKTINFDILSRYKYAGDHYLWQTFSQNAELYIVHAWLSGFKIHENQLSVTNKLKYSNETKNHSRKINILDLIYIFFSRIMWILPLRVKKLNNRLVIEFDHQSKKYIRRK